VTCIHYCFGVYGAEKKKKAQSLAKELSSLMDVKAEEWVNDLKAKRHEM
jgi:hypothetical protein